MQTYVIRYWKRPSISAPRYSQHGAVCLRNTKAGALLWTGAVILVLSVLPGCAAFQTRNISFYNMHTEERLRVTYRWCDRYQPVALAAINHELRDHYSGQELEIDPKLLDYLFDLMTKLRYHGDVYIISGYRSADTNAKLRERSPGIARISMHMQGRALDFRLPGVDTRLIWQTARAMQRGGAGYYRDSDFVHIDTGRVRFW